MELSGQEAEFSSWKVFNLQEELVILFRERPGAETGT